MKPLKHDYPFDPSYGYSLEDLLAVDAPDAPSDHEEFWKARYERALALDPAPVLTGKGSMKRGWRVYDMEHQSTGGATIGGWCLLPASGMVERGMVFLHGYGGREEPFRENNETLCRILEGKGIGHRLHYWGERAHRGHYWRQMGPIFV